MTRYYDPAFVLPWGEAASAFGAAILAVPLPPAPGGGALLSALGAVVTGLLGVRLASLVYMAI